MDLNTLMKIAQQENEEAQRAFNAGHHDNAKKHLMTNMMAIAKYFNVNTQEAADVTLPNDKKNSEDTVTETQAAVPGADVPQPGIVPFDGTSKVLPASQFGKPNQ